MKHEMINPHDKILIDTTDKAAAQIAVLMVGRGKYGIENGILPLLIFGDVESWSQKEYGKSFAEFLDSVDKERVALALESMEIVGNRSSMFDPVANARDIATQLRHG